MRTLVALTAGLVLGLSASPGPGQSSIRVVATGLEVPWALTFAPDGRLYITERAGRVRVLSQGRLDSRPVATLRAAARGEAGLMGVAADPRSAEPARLYVCYTLDKGGRLVNRVSVLTLAGGSAGERVLLDDIPGAAIHDGCRVKFGPDGKLYVTTGDAAEPGLAQRLDSPAGKILRLNPDGTVPADNPFPGSPVYSLGHRNVQGIAWDRAGRLWASEHGPSGVPWGHDELNVIRPGGNYGWPEVYGRGGAPRFEDPVLESGRRTWAPAGLAILGDDLYMAQLRGERLLRVRITADGRVASTAALLDGTHGRLRDVVVSPAGTLYVTTSNRDGRGRPGPDDDRILELVP